MNRSLFVVGSREGLRAVFGDHALAARGPDVDVVILPTAAAFTGAAEASVAVAQVCSEFDVRVESLMVTDRASAGEAYFSARIVEADLVVLCDGSALHARAVWRNTIGSVVSVLGDVMIDPRGGAPTIGMGLCRGVAFCVPSSDDQLARTRSLVAKDTSLVVVGPRGVLHYAKEAWRVIDGDDVVVTRGQDAAAL